MNVAISAVAVAVSALSASAAITSVTQVAGSFGIDAVQTDGSWDFSPGTMMDPQGGDYGIWNGNAIWMREAWIGNVGQSASFLTTVDDDTISGRSFTVPIEINKRVENVTDFDFSSYEIRLIAQGGTTLSSVDGFVNGQFSDVTVTEVVAGIEYLIDYSAVGSDTGTIQGAASVFTFDFEITGGVDFEIIQTAIPTPGALALGSIAGIAALRKRRRN